MSAHRSSTRIDRFNRVAKKAGRGFLKGADVTLTVLHRTALRTEADRLQAEADETRRKAWNGEHENGFIIGLFDSWNKQDDADKAKARYEDAIGH